MHPRVVATMHPGRRRVLAAVGSLTASLALPVRAQSSRTPSAGVGGGHGLVLPRAPAPQWPVTDVAGRRAALAARLRGRVTAVQLIFTGCSSTCPVQGAVFAAIAHRPPAPDIRLLSLTVDPLGDDPKQLEAWLGRFDAPSIWSAAAPQVDQVEPLSGFLRGAPARTDTHSTQVFLFDRDARLAFRTVPNPTPEHVADLLKQLAAA